MQPDSRGPNPGPEPGQSPPVARIPAELLELIKIFDARVSALETRTEVPGPPGAAGRDGLDGTDGRDADCSVLAGQVKVLAERVEVLERMLTPDASGRMTGLPPFFATFLDVETGKQWTAKVYLGDGFRDTPPKPKKLIPSLRGEGQ